MRVMVLVKATEDSEKGVMPTTELLDAMMKYNEELVKAGIMLAGEGLRYTSTAHMVVFLYTAPIFAALGLHWWLPAERLAPLQWAGIALAFTGIVVAFFLRGSQGAGPDWQRMLWGDLLGLLAGAAWGATTVLIRVTRLSSLPASQTLLYQLVVGFALLVPLAVLAAAGLWLRRRGAWLRLVALAALALALVNPVVLDEEREPLKSVVAVVVDRSQSQDIGDRAGQTDAALAGIEERLSRFKQFDVRVVETGRADAAEDRTETRLFSALAGALRDVPPSRVGGAVMITDGEVHDAPAGAPDLNAPLHALITGHEQEKDRRIRFEKAPRFGLVGKPLDMTYRVIASNGEAGPVDVRVSVNGEQVAVERAFIGQEMPLQVTVPNAGRNIVELAIPEEEGELTGVLRSGKWGRGNGTRVAKFEEQVAQLMGAKHALATSSGTAALLTVLSALDIGPGDEVVLSPYTFVACVNVILARNALPVFADTDSETFQIDPKSIERVLTSRTAAIMPVHLGGATFDVDAIQAIARKRNLPVVEDSCQSHLAEWRGKRTGSFGTAGCFSFQASKNLNGGEGGAILSSSDELIEKCYTFHNNGRGRVHKGYDFSYRIQGLNLRMTEFQGGLLTAQMMRVQAQSEKRETNAKYLSSLLRESRGLTPAKMYDGCTRNAYHLYMMRYDPAQFSGLSRAKFLKALGAEGVPASGGYTPLNKEPFLKATLESRGFQAVYSKQRLSQWEEANNCPGNDRLCSEAVWFTQNMLLGPRSDMDQIAQAVQKIRRYAGDLAKA